ncbi:FecR family protein [Mariniflexile sp.]|uniref:FecR family protein n=1 Tax=Mariniflexile sp. TaxID=1979402 RepID=UPI004047E25F
MNNNKIELIFHKFLENTATPEEIDFLSEWVDKNKSSFKELVEINHMINSVIEKEKAHRLKKSLTLIYNQVERDEKSKKRNSFFKYAAIFIGAITLGIYTYTQINNNTHTPQKEVIITLEDGATKETLNSKSSGIIASSSTYVAKQDGTKIIYEKVASNDGTSKLVYNTLDVPYGKKFQVVLSDGTEVYLNSGSSLMYPVAFHDKGPRNVILKGEAYFSVKSDSLRPFSVSTNFLSAKVLGTQFNVSSYSDDDHINVVLVEGSLSVSKNNIADPSTLILKPNQLAAYSYTNNKLSKENVDVSSHIAWKDGILLFKNESFYQITKKLERHYDLKIEINDLEVSKERYTGRFKTETIEEVLKAFQKIKDFEYTIETNNITINPKKLII